MANEEEEQRWNQVLDELIEATHRLPPEDQEYYFLFACQTLKEESQTIRIDDSKKRLKEEAISRKVAEIRDKFKKTQSHNEKR